MTKKYTEEQIKEAEEVAIFYGILFGEEITAEEILETEEEDNEDEDINTTTT